MTEWPTKTLAQAGVRLIDCVHKTPPASPTGFPYITIPEMKNGRIDFGAARKISPADFEEWTKKAKPELHDVILSRRTNPGVTATFGEQSEFALGQNLVLLRADGTSVLPEFLRWLTVGPYWWKEIERFRNAGAVFDSLRCADVPRFALPIPPIDHQRSIASLLSAFDDKIQWNVRGNHTMAAMAEMVFRDWFIDFGPIRRKLAGASDSVAVLGGLIDDLARADEIAASFPEGFDDAGVPIGWRQAAVGSLADIVGGSTPSTNRKAFWDNGTYAWATPKDLSSNEGIFLFETKRSVTDAGLASISSKLCPVGSVLLSSRAPVGYLAIASIPVAVNQGFIVLRPCSSFPTSFAYFWCKSNMDLIKSNANGSTFQEISKRNFRPLFVTVPTQEVMKNFIKIVDPLMALIEGREKENRILAETRDCLLPQLISGRVRVMLPEGSEG